VALYEYVFLVIFLEYWNNYEPLKIFSLITNVS